jgi:hypothetical protein
MWKNKKTVHTGESMKKLFLYNTAFLRPQFGVAEIRSTKMYRLCSPVKTNRYDIYPVKRPDLSGQFRKAELFDGVDL